MKVGVLMHCWKQCISSCD